MLLFKPLNGCTMWLRRDWKLRRRGKLKHWRNRNRPEPKQKSFRNCKAQTPSSNVLAAKIRWPRGENLSKKWNAKLLSQSDNRRLRILKTIEGFGILRLRHATLLGDLRCHLWPRSTATRHECSFQSHRMASILFCSVGTSWMWIVGYIWYIWYTSVPSLWIVLCVKVVSNWRWDNWCIAVLFNFWLSSASLRSLQWAYGLRRGEMHASELLHLHCIITITNCFLLDKDILRRKTTQISLELLDKELHASRPRWQSEYDCSMARVACTRSFSAKM